MNNFDWKTKIRMRNFPNKLLLFALRSVGEKTLTINNRNPFDLSHMYVYQIVRMLIWMGDLVIYLFLQVQCSPHMNGNAEKYGIIAMLHVK